MCCHVKALMAPKGDGVGQGDDDWNWSKTSPLSAWLVNFWGTAPLSTPVRIPRPGS
jgi:hypothetical protein